MLKKKKTKKKKNQGKDVEERLHVEKKLWL